MQTPLPALTSRCRRALQHRDARCRIVCSLGCGNARVRATCRATLSAPSLMRCPPPPGSLCQGSSRRAPSGRASPWRLATCPAHARMPRAVGTWVHGWLWRGICCGHCECCKVALHHRRHSPGVSLGPRRSALPRGPARRLPRRIAGSGVVQTHLGERAAVQRRAETPRSVRTLTSTYQAITSTYPLLALYFPLLRTN